MKAKCVILFLLLPLITSAQQVWTIEQCIEYAKNENAVIKRSETQAEISKISHQQSKENFLPNLNANASQNFSFGRSLTEDNIYMSNNVFNTNIGVSAGLTLFKGMQMINEVYQTDFNFQAALMDVKKQQDDICLQIMTCYLQILFNKEAVKVAESKLELTKLQAKQTEILVEAGKKPKGELSEANALVAQDKVSLLDAKTTLETSYLTLTQLLYLGNEDVKNFDVSDDVSFMMTDVLNKSVSEIYDAALEFLPSIKGEELRIKSQEYSVKMAKGAYSPQLSFGASYGNGYYYTQGGANLSFADQFAKNNNFGLNFSLYIPIFDRMSTPNAIKRSKLTLDQQSDQLETAKNNLRKEIQNAYVNAYMAQQKIQLAEANLQASEEAFNYQSEKYEAGAATLYELNESKNRYTSAKLSQVQAKFNYLFRTRILSYYNGELRF